jgi:CHASE2 domain-containing sensor protein
VSTTVRNVLIIVALGAAVAFVPGGGHTADFVSAVLGVAISAAIVLILARLYRENRVTIFGLGDTHRALLYGAIGLVVVAMAARRSLFDTGAGTLAWFVMVAGASFALYTVWRHYREYSL